MLPHPFFFDLDEKFCYSPLFFPFCLTFVASGDGLLSAASLLSAAGLHVTQPKVFPLFCCKFWISMSAASAAAQPLRRVLGGVRCNTDGCNMIASFR